MQTLQPFVVEYGQQFRNERQNAEREIAIILYFDNL